MGATSAHETPDGMTRRGLGLPVALPPEIIRGAAITARDRRYSSFWLNNPPRSDALSALGGVARVATGIRLGVGVIPLSDHRPEDIVHAVRQNDLPADRLFLGVGSGSGAGAVERVRDGIRAIRAALKCSLVIAALGPRMCRLAGAEADGVLLNWLTPQWAQRSIEWVKDGANTAGRPMPRAMAYVRAARGGEALARLQREAAGYEAVPHYTAHFERMGTPAVGTAVTGETPEDIQRGLAVWNGVVDEVIVRAVVARDTLEEVLDLVEAARPIA
ncbi:MAG TPA: LLM class flavin-dependent oxidoreductase [Candidatus Methylomirabilis sp.]|nr:LLM class flavin-dependent oxidoreductase [Candidatus Methylomirabilis sp.]